MKVIEKSWSKRRTLEESKKVKSVSIPDYKQEVNHFCNMHVVYEDGTTATYLSRVIRNDIKDEWIVDGMHVAVKM